MGNVMNYLHENECPVNEKCYENVYRCNLLCCEYTSEYEADVVLDSLRNDHFGPFTVMDELYRYLNY